MEHMKNINLNKLTEMETQILMVAGKIITGFSKIFTTTFGKIVALMGFFTALGLGSIAPLIHIIIAFVFVDMLFGLAVTIHKKGWSHILSCRLRDSLVKVFFYLLIIIGLFLIETQFIDGYAVTSKVAFGLIAGTELWSIMANMLVLFPNIPILRMLQKLLVKEIASKTGSDECTIENELNKAEENENKTSN